MASVGRYVLSLCTSFAFRHRCGLVQVQLLLCYQRDLPHDCFGGLKTGRRMPISLQLSFFPTTFKVGCTTFFKHRTMFLRFVRYLRKLYCDIAYSSSGGMGLPVHVSSPTVQVPVANPVISDLANDGSPPPFLLHSPRFKVAEDGSVLIYFLRDFTFRFWRHMPTQEEMMISYEDHRYPGFHWVPATVEEYLLAENHRVRRLYNQYL